MRNRYFIFLALLIIGAAGCKPAEYNRRVDCSAPVNKRTPICTPAPEIGLGVPDENPVDDGSTGDPSGSADQGNTDDTGNNGVDNGADSGDTGSGDAGPVREPTVRELLDEWCAGMDDYVLTAEETAALPFVCSGDRINPNFYALTTAPYAGDAAFVTDIPVELEVDNDKMYDGVPFVETGYYYSFILPTPFKHAMDTVLPEADFMDIVTIAELFTTTIRITKLEDRPADPTRKGHTDGTLNEMETVITINGSEDPFDTIAYNVVHDAFRNEAGTLGANFIHLSEPTAHCKALVSLRVMVSTGSKTLVMGFTLVELAVSGERGLTLEGILGRSKSSQENYFISLDNNPL